MAQNTYPATSYGPMWWFLSLVIPEKIAFLGILQASVQVIWYIRLIIDL